MKHYLLIILSLFCLASCHRADEADDVLSQEDISDIILNVTDDAGKTATYDYTLNSVNNPVIHLADGKTYTVNVLFRNGTQDATQSIIDAKDEHFLLYNFVNSTVAVTRVDSPASVRTDGARVGLKTIWKVGKAVGSSPCELILTLIHGATAVDEAQSGSTWGSVTGGETDALATYGISN